MKSTTKCKELLEILAPWFRYATIGGDFSLRVASSKPPDIATSTWTIMNNLFYLTVMFSSDFSSEVENIWKNLCQGNGSDTNSDLKLKRQKMSTIIDILMLLMLKASSPRLIKFTKTIAVYICRQGSGSLFFETITSRLLPENLSGIPVSELESIVIGKCIPARGLYFATMEDLETLSGPTNIYSTVFLSSTFLVDAISELDPSIVLPHLSLLLTVIFVYLDAGEIECEEMRLLLVNLLQRLLSGETDVKGRLNAVVNALNLRVMLTD
jgi:hypothetical protein